MQILSDSKMQDWLWSEHICLINHNPGWKLHNWITALRVGSIRITCNTVVLYFEYTLKIDDVPPLKNALETLCRVIRQYQPGSRIFVSNLLPRISKSPVGRPIEETNFTLLQAIRSVNRAMGRVFYLSVYEHFVSKRGKVITPIHKYFKENEELTNYGCMILRECFLRETGLKGYWFSEREGRK